MRPPRRKAFRTRATRGTTWRSLRISPRSWLTVTQQGRRRKRGPGPKRAASGAPRGARFRSQGSAACPADDFAHRLLRAGRLRQPLTGPRTPRRLAALRSLLFWERGEAAQSSGANAPRERARISVSIQLVAAAVAALLFLKAHV